MKAKIFGALVVVAALGGCAQMGPNQAVGTGVGAVGGYAVGKALGGGAVGSAVGAVVGASVGGAVGQNMDRPAPPPVVVQQPPVVVYERPVQCRMERRWDPYYNAWVDRRVCYR